MLRLYGVRAEQLADAVERSKLDQVDERGNERHLVRVGEETLIVVLAADDPSFVITLWEVS